ncbi:hypothetical protein ACFR9U_05900 [Halorientalis brevis]|uniref:Transcriptional regulator n=1 Tax=Halorientalis brevis TaxID=1126241 RepID=A0ABD6C8L5_9EURY|nr:hypothetical protein [Halorientalis brevis]
MVELGVLTCPVCEQARVCRMDQFETRDAVKDCASVHLREHRLDESKRAIYRVLMAERLNRFDATDSTEYPLGEWTTDGRELSA